jgi:hypothetical protein
VRKGTLLQLLNARETTTGHSSRWPSFFCSDKQSSRSFPCSCNSRRITFSTSLHVLSALI